VTQNTPWTPAEDSDLARMWLDGRKVRDIAKTMGRSKNSCISRAHRIGLPGRPSPIMRRPGGAAGVKVSRQRTVRMVAAAPAVVPEPVTVFLPPRASTCQWIEGDPADQRFCDAPTIARSVYCGIHHARCYVRIAA